MRKKDLKYEDLEKYIVIPHIPWKDLERVMGKRMYKKFIKFMFGQTCVEGGAYPQDVRNFFSDRRFFD